VLYCGLDDLLAERGITGRQLSLEAGVTEATVSKLRRNTFVSIDAATFARICRYLQVQPGELLSVR
jgi:putative transcriptional regulator